ncbi:MAG TPA: hypothetical protein VGG64_17170 [Pirellulales bacterium]
MSCPLCKTNFEAITGGEGGYQSTMRLDLMPVGAITPAYPKPVCPKCGFVLFNFSGIRAAPMSDAEEKQCREIIATKDYKDHIGRSSHCLMGYLFEGMKRHEWELAFVFLEASWQEEYDTKKWAEDLERSQKHMRSFLSNAKAHDQKWESAQMLDGEFSRRLGEFDDAQKHFEGLKAINNFQGNFLGQMVDYQLRLIAAKDDKPHTIKEMQDKK